MRSEGYGSRFLCVCVCVCLSVDAYLRTTGNEAADEGFQRLQFSVRSKNNVAILLKRRRSRSRNRGGRGQRRSDMPAITSLINEIFADTAFILRRECMGS